MKNEPTRTREGGTKVTQPVDGHERVVALRRIVERGQYAKIDGVMVDLFSANAIVQIYDLLNPENQERYRQFKVTKMADIAFKLINAQKERSQA